MKSDVIIILGYAVNRSGKLLDISKWRIEKAVELYNKGITKKIIVSGGNENYFNGTDKSLAYWMKKYAIKLGVSPKNIFIEGKSSDTKENIIFSEKICKEKKWKNIIIVTSKAHIPRVKKITKNIMGSKYDVKLISSPTKKTSWKIFEKMWENKLLQPITIKIIHIIIKF